MKPVWRLSSFFVGGPQSFFSQLSADWMRATIPIPQGVDSNLLFTKSTDFSVDLRNVFTAAYRLVFDKEAGYHNLAKMTHETNHGPWPG